MELKRKKLLKGCLTIIGVLALFITFAVFTIYAESRDNKRYKSEYFKALEREKFYFFGVVIRTEDIDRGGGFICLRKTDTNKPAGYYFKVEGNFVASVKENEILYLGGIGLPGLDNERKQLQVGDSVCFNCEFDKKFRIYRNSKVISEYKATVGRVYYNKRYKFQPCLYIGE